KRDWSSDVCSSDLACQPQQHTQIQKTIRDHCFFFFRPSCGAPDPRTKKVGNKHRCTDCTRCVFPTGSCSCEGTGNRSGLLSTMTSTDCHLRPVGAPGAGFQSVGRPTMLRYFPTALRSAASSARWEEP